MPYPISHIKKCIFVHTPKCAGSSMHKAIGKNAGDWENHSGHWSVAAIYNRWGKQYPLDEYFKFTFVRNPWGRIASAYFNALKSPTQWKGWMLGFPVSGGYPVPTFKQFIEKLYSRVDEISSLIEVSHRERGYAHWEELPNNIHYCPMLSFLTKDGKCDMDFIGRFENLSEDWKYVSNIIGAPSSLEHQRKNFCEGYSSNYKDYYDDDTMNMVGELYKQDIEYFNYSF